MARRTRSDLLTWSELSSALGADLPTAPHAVTISKWVQQGMPVAERGRGGRPSRYDLEAVRAWLRQRTEAADAGAPIDVARERARYFRLQADRTELDVRKRAGELVEAAEVEQRWASIVTAVRESLLSLPDVAVQRGIVAPANEDALVELVDEALRDLAMKGQAEPASSPTRRRRGTGRKRTAGGGSAPGRVP